MKLVLSQSCFAARARSYGMTALASLAALAAFSCNGTAPPTNHPSNANAPANSNARDVSAQALPTDTIPNLGMKFEPASGEFKKGLVVVEGNVPAGTTVNFRIVVKRSDGDDVEKTGYSLAPGKNFVAIPLAENELGKVTEVNWKETAVDPAQWKFDRHRMIKPENFGANVYAAMAYVTKLGEVECCPQDATIRGIFTTPIGVRVYLQQ